MTSFQFIKFATKIVAAAAIFYWASGPIHAQTTDAKRTLAARVVAAQAGPEMDRLLEQIAGSATQQLIGNWSDRVAAMPEAKRQSAVTALDAELKKFNDATLKAVTAQAAKVRSDALVTAYTERFSEDELKQLAALMEAPAYKKYQSTAPELGNVYVKAIVDGTRADVESRGKAFDATAAKITGTPAPNGAPAPAPAPAPSSAPAKKP